MLDGIPGRDVLRFAPDLAAGDERQTEKPSNKIDRQGCRDATDYRERVKAAERRLRIVVTKER